MQFPEFFTVKEVATTLKLHPLTIYEYIRAHKLPAVKFGRYYRVSLSDLHRFLDMQKVT
jgi:excisionase family DNA binding protein